MSKRETIIINLIGGPCIGKTTMAALIFAKIKLQGYTCEYIQEYAKTLVWQQKFDKLNDQYAISMKQYALLAAIHGSVDYIITDGPLVQGLYYNRYNLENNSNIERTEAMILAKHSSMKSINILLSRGDFAYEQAGRMQNEEEAKEIDVMLRHILKKNGVEFCVMESHHENADNIVDFILAKK